MRRFFQIVGLPFRAVMTIVILGIGFILSLFVPHACEWQDAKDLVRWMWTGEGI